MPPRPQALRTTKRCHANLSSGHPKTSLKQIAANRRNASKSTGPRTEEGQHRSRCNGVRHGLTAETVIGALEDADDYKAFEAAITVDYDAQSTVERELVLRLAGLFWRLRRATAIEAGLFEIQAEHVSDLRRERHVDPVPRQIVCPTLRQSSLQPDYEAPVSFATGEPEMALPADPRVADPANPSVDLARSFLRLANSPNCALDRLSRYEAGLWRQVGQTLVTLDELDRRKSAATQSRRRTRRPGPSLSQSGFPAAAPS